MTKEFVILGFSVTNSLNLKRLRSAWNKDSELVNNKVFLGRNQSDTKEILSHDLGGELILMDINKSSMEIINQIDVLTPMGLLYDPHSTSLFVGSDHWINRIANGVVSKFMDHQYFNCIHGLSDSGGGKILITATGLDAILEIDIASKKLEYTWFATENGYDLQANGERRTIDRNFNYQGLEFSTLEHTTHVNSSLVYQGNILATLFHQGELVEIDRKSGLTKVIMSGLTHPHNIRKSKDGYMISDTNGQRIIMLNNKLQAVREIYGKYNWIQDAIQLTNGNLVIADANNGRIVLTSASGVILNEFFFGADNKRIGVLAKIKDFEAKNVFNF